MNTPADKNTSIFQCYARYTTSVVCALMHIYSIHHVYLIMLIRTDTLRNRECHKERGNIGRERGIEREKERERGGERDVSMSECV